MNDNTTQTKLSFKQKLNLVFDDNLRTHVWQNMVDWFIIALIIVSTVEVFLSTFDGVNAKMGNLLNGVDLVTTIIFTIEVSLRIWCADLLDPKYKGFKGRVKYCLSFYGFVDFISTYSFYLALIFPIPYLALKVLRVLRLVRVFRYMKSFRILGEAVSSKKQELGISLAFLSILTVLLSFLLYFAEHAAQPDRFENGWGSLVWAFAKYLGDPGKLADFELVTPWGNIIAIIVGILGIAIFAVPAGLIGSGFVEVIEDKRRNEMLASRIKDINNRFDASTGPKAYLDGRQAGPRYLSFDALQSVCLLTDEEIVEAVRESDNLRYHPRNVDYDTSLRFRPKKSDYGMSFADLKVLERYKTNTSYGFCRRGEGQKFCILNIWGATEHGVSHFVETIADNTQMDVITRERRFFGTAEELGQTNHEAYITMTDPNASKMESEVEHLPQMFQDYLTDLRQIKPDQLAIIVVSGAPSRADVVVEWGMPKGTEGFQFEDSHVQPQHQELVKHFVETLQHNLAEVRTTTPRKNEIVTHLSFDTHSIGAGQKKTHIARGIFNNCQASVVMVYLNVKTILQGSDDNYYSALKAMLDTMDELSRHQ